MVVRSGSNGRLRQMVDPAEHDRGELMGELEGKEVWSANELAAYSAAYYDRQAEVFDDADLRHRAFVNARNHIKGAGGRIEPMPGQKKGHYVIGAGEGKGLVPAMARTFGASRAREYLDLVRDRQQETEYEYQEWLAGRPGRPAAVERRAPDALDVAVIQFMLQVLVGKRRGGEFVDVRRLRRDLGAFLDLYDAVSEGEANESAVLEAQRLHDRLTDTGAYVLGPKERRRDVTAPGMNEALGVDWGDVFPWLPVMGE